MFGIVLACVCVCGPVQGYIGQMSETHLPAEIPGKMSKSAAVQSLGSMVRSDVKTSHKFTYFPQNFAPFLYVNRSTLLRPGFIHLCENGLKLQPGDAYGFILEGGSRFLPPWRDCCWDDPPPPPPQPLVFTLNSL